MPSPLLRGKDVTVGSYQRLCFTTLVSVMCSKNQRYIQLAKKSGSLTEKKMCKQSSNS